MTRPGWDDYGLGIAKAVSARADCTRRKVGAVIFDAEHRIVSTGYNGSAPGGPSCLVGMCPRGKHYQVTDTTDTACKCDAEHCACGQPWPCADAVAPTSSYDTGPGSCIALHAEQNAIVWADPSRLRNSVIYITDTPCAGCSRLISGVGISRVVISQ